MHHSRLEYDNITLASASAIYWSIMGNGPKRERGEHIDSLNISTNCGSLAHNSNMDPFTAAHKYITNSTSI